MIRASAYCRVSTDTEDQLNSLGAQEEFFKRYCSQQDMELIRIYSDEGISGTKKANRKAFLQMLQDAEQNKFDYLLVKDISRLARNIVDSIETIRFLKKHIQKVIFVNQPNLTDDEFVLGIMGLIAQQESENLSKRVKFGKKLNMEKGKVPNFVYGYDKEPGDYFNLIINEAEANIVRRIFGYYTVGGYGCSTIANILNKEGVTTKQGAKWQQVSVARILKNEIYIGNIINGREEIIEIYSYERKSIPTENWLITHRPELSIIDRESFEQAQAIMGQRNNAFINDHKRNSNKYVFSTLIKCGECKSTFRRLQVRNKNKSATWGCNNRNYYGAEACSNKNTVKEEELLEAIRQYICVIYEQKEEMIRWTLEELKKLCRKTITPVQLRKQKEKELSELNRKYERQIVMCEKGLLDFSEFEKRSMEVKLSIEGLKAELETLGEVEGDEKLNNYWDNLFEDIDKTLASRLLTNQLLKSIIEYIEVNEDGRVKIYMKQRAEVEENASVPNRNNCT